MKNNIVETQKKILKIVRNYFLNKKTLNQKSYFALYSNSEGRQYIKKVIYKNNTSKLKQILKSNLNLIDKSNLKIISNFKNRKYYENIIVTWGNKSSFSPSGVFKDKYFSSLSSDNLNTFWIVLSDREIKKKIINNNVAIVYPQKNFFNLFNFIKILILNIIYFVTGSENKIKDHDTLISDVINSFIFHNKNFIKVKKLIMPYEGQIFQKKIFIEQKKRNKNLKTYGFDHSAPHSISTQLYYTYGSPDKLLVSGSSTKKCYSKFYNWPSKKILLTYPIRYKKFTKKNFLNKIFLPYDITNFDLILENIDSFLKNKKNKTLNKLNIRIHPEKINDENHILLKDKIKKIINKHNKKFSKKAKDAITVAVGFTTTPLVASEFKLSVLHICPNPDFDAYLNYFWRNLVVKRINKFSYLYRSKKIGTYLNFKNKNKLLEITND